MFYLISANGFFIFSFLALYSQIWYIFELHQLCISWWYIHQSFTARKVEEDMTSTYLQFMRGLLGTTTVFNHCRIQDKIASRIQLDATDDRYSYQELFSLTSVKEA
ncbi:uncharacterized protein LOC129887426 isoform X1 [Solanum dulcamara]|uniref:uncharacterized protein LOC129887426 isoform X1 n=1 Tax=Solanum dulcamara TaxID=45834 RepID=UPI0024857744|nr:uncharacterized protein LOC129887426 isoform X1 [Solanum dulcamara]